MQGQAVFEELSLNKCVLEKIRLDIKHFARKCQLDKSVLRTYTAEKKKLIKTRNVLLNLTVPFGCHFVCIEK